MPPLRLLCVLIALASAAHAADVPRLPSVTIDGSLGDWSDRGFVIENLASLDAQPVPAANLSARARFGWDDQGFLFAIEIEDNVITEAAAELYTADSVELFLARSVGADDRFQVLLAPGLNPLQAGPRIAYEDRRKNKTSAASIEAARTATATGYILEGRVPWRMLGWSPEGTLGVQVIVNDADHGPGRHKWVWHPGEQSSSDSRQLNEVRLAGIASPPDRVVWRWRPLESGRLAVVVASNDKAATTTQWITARENDRLIAQVALVPNPAGMRSEFIVPAQGEDITVALDDRPLGVIPLKSAGRPDSTKINRADYTLTPAVFSGNMFPEARLAKAAEIEKLLGPVTIHPRYFDAGQQEVTTPVAPGRYGVVYEIKPLAGPAVLRYQTLFKLPQEINWRTARMEFPAIELPREMGLDPANVRRHVKDFEWLFNDTWRTQLAETAESAIVLAAIADATPGSSPATARDHAWRRNQDWWHQLRKKLGQWEQYDHVVHTPEGYGEDREKRWPLVLFLHGSGDGENRQILQKWGPPRQQALGRKFPFILVAPRSPAGQWQGWYAPQLGALLDDIEANYRVDKNRIYVTGLSMGGSGTWRLASEFPDRFAAIAPFCGGGNESEAPRIAHIPTWAFHGDQDKAVPVEYTLRMIEAVKKAGGQPRMTIYPGVGHVCWEEAYGGQEFYDWLLAQRRP
ncbi:MAG: phospholipase/carboxylesterase [Rariglobus sp.]|jgi:pimeloyl-ACP methyl ester carboxylesterase|nr:phospholipase/carboxylesterase [Rariglobus sp.]